MKTRRIHASSPLLAAIAALFASHIAHAADGTLKSGSLAYTNNWSDTTKWVGSIVANGADYTADLSSVSLGTTRTWTLDSSRTIGNLKFGDTGNSYDWTLTNSGSAVLTLQTTTGTPTITVTNRTTTISLSLAGNNGLTKEGNGTLILSNGAGYGTDTNTYTGTTTVNAGTLYVTGQLSDSTAVTVNGGTYTLGKSDTVGDVTLQSGTISGSSYALTGNSYTLQSGTVSAQLAGTNGLTKTTAGTVTLSGANTYSGTTRVTQGTLALGNTNALGASILDLNAADSGTVTFTTAGNNTYIVPGLTGSRNLDFGANTLAIGGISTYSGVLSGTGGLTKNGSGTVTLSNANLYTGVTYVSSGTLNVTGSIADTSAVTVSGSSSIYTVGADDSVGVVTVQSGGTINGTGTLTGTSYTLGNGTVAVSLAGNGTLTKDSVSSGTLTASNTYTGGTIVNGPLILGNATDTLPNTGSVTVNSGGSLSLGANSDTVGAVTLAGGSITSSSGVLTGASYAFQGGSVSAILGGGGVVLNKTTAGTLTLSGANTFSGGVNLRAGTLNINNAAALSNGTFAIGDSTGSTVVTLNNTSGADIVSSTYNNLQAWNQDFTYTGSKSLNLGTGAVTLSGNRLVTVNANILAVGGSIGDGSAGYSLTKAGAGTLTLNASNTYSGGTNLSAGTLVLGYPNNALANTGAVTVSGGTLDLGSNNETVGAITLTGGTIIGTGTLTGSSYNLQSGTVNVKLGGSVALAKSGSGSVTLTGSNSLSGGTTISAGTLVLGNATDTLPDTGAVTINGTGILSLGSNSDTVGAVTLAGGSITGSGTLTGSSYSLQAGSISAILGGTGALTKTTTGTIILSGSNTYTGTTTISGGILQIGGSSTTGSLSTTSAIVDNGNITFNRSNNLVQGTDFSGASITGTGSLTQAGSGSTLTLNVPNGFGGGTTISAGKIQITDSSALGTGAVAVSAGSGNQLLLSNGINVGNALTLDAGGSSSQGVLYLASGTATYSGPINITAAPYSGGHFAAGSGAVLNVTGPVTSAVSQIFQSGGGIVVFSGGGSGYTTFSQTNTSNLVTRLGANNGLATAASVAVSYATNEGFDLAGFNQSLIGISAGGSTSLIGNSSTTSDSTLTLTGTSTWGGVIADAFLGSGSRKTNLTVNGGSVTLTRANTYSGATTVTNYGALNIDFSVYSIAGNIVSGSSALTLNGSALTVKGKSSTSNTQSFTSTTFNSGASVATGTRGTGTSPNLLVNLGPLTRNTAATVDFILPAGTQSSTNGFITATINTNGILGGWATVSGSDWASNNGTDIVAYASYTNDTWAGGNNTTVTADGTPASGSTTNSLRFNAAAARTLTLTGTNTLQSGGILVTSLVANNATTISGGSLQGPTNGELIVIQNNSSNTLSIASSIVANGTAGLTKSGIGTLNLAGANTYTGDTVINGGTLALGATTDLVNSSTVRINGASSKLQLANGITDVVASLVINGVAQTGTWGATGSGAAHIDNNHFAGTGILSVDPYGSDFATWASSYGLVGGRDGDDIGSGLSNQQKYAFGLDPKNAAAGSPITPHLSKTNGHISYTRRKPSYTGLNYTYEYTTTLTGSWTPFSPDTATSDNGDPVETVSVTVPNALLTNSVLFIRVKAQ